mmetsp:Transcript_119514/g.211246  ORF Transcript_119514/g.211246 Transcript_119514/m.211246 type:complete len:86 (-) Transcript_119514:205-462(-)
MAISCIISCLRDSWVQLIAIPYLERHVKSGGPAETSTTGFSIAAKLFGKWTLATGFDQIVISKEAGSWSQNELTGRENTTVGRSQ